MNTKQKNGKKDSKNWELTIGSDFELFIKDNETQKFVSSLDLFDDKDKYDPFVIDDHTKFFCDNVLFEGNVKYATTKKDLVENFRFTLTKMAECLSEKYGDRYSFIADAAHEFDDESLNNPKAREAGCSVSYNAHTKGISETAPFEKVNTRTSALHAHFGRTDFNKIKNRKGQILLDHNSRNDIVLLSDLFIGNTMNLIDNDVENSILRRKYYGKSGELRTPPFGVEYRVLHSYFLRHPSMIEFLYDLSVEMFKYIRAGQEQVLLNRFNMETLSLAINTNNKEISKAIFDGLDMPKHIIEQVEMHKDITYDSDVLSGWGIKVKNLDLEVA